MNITREDFCNRLGYIVYKAKEFDALYSSLDQNELTLEVYIGELALLRNDCLCALCDNLIEIAVSKPHNCYVEFVNSCLVDYVWAIDEDNVDYDYYVSLINDNVSDNKNLPMSFDSSMLYHAAISACRIEDFYSLLYIAESYSDK